MSNEAVPGGLITVKDGKIVSVQHPPDEPGLGGATKTVLVRCSYVLPVEVPAEWDDDSTLYAIENGCPASAEVRVALNQLVEKHDKEHTCWGCAARGENRVISPASRTLVAGGDYAIEFDRDATPDPADLLKMREELSRWVKDGTPRAIILPPGATLKAYDPLTMNSAADWLDENALHDAAAALREAFPVEAKHA